MFNKTSETQTTPTGQPQTTPTGQPQPAREPAKSSGMPSIISADLKVVGNLQCAGDIQIEGTVEGDIHSQSVTVGEGAQVSGSIHGETVRVSGAVRGEIEANSVTLEKSAKVTGDIIHQTLTIEAGAFLEGHCRRLQSDKRSGAEAKVTDLKPAPREGAAAKPAAG